MATTAAHQVLIQAVQQHQNGRLAEAELLYRDVLAISPEHPDALHLLGVLLAQRGRRDEAIDLISRAIAIRPNVADYHGNLGGVLVTVDRVREAVAAYRRSLELEPNQVAVWANLGEALRGLGRLDDAVDACRRAVALDSKSPLAWHNLAMSLRDRQEIAEALTACRQSLSLSPQFGYALRTLGELLLNEKKPVEAVAALERAVELLPDDVLAHDGLGAALQSDGQFERAIVEHQRALALKPDWVGAYVNLGNAFSVTERYPEAIVALNRALDLRPDSGTAHYTLACALKSNGQLAEAIAVYRRAIELDPQNGPSVHMLAGTLLESGLLTESQAEFRHAQEIDPDDLAAHSNFLYTMHNHPDIGAEEIFRHHMEYDRMRVRPLAETISPPGNDASPERRLRIGYVSADLRLHSVAFFLLPILEAHDHARFEIVGFPTARARDGITDRFQSACDGWHNLSRSNDDEATRIIRDLGIDILVDLSGHTGNNRLMLFARKPAPIQVSYLGYPNTTGLSTMDYRLTDVHADPTASSDALCSEWLVRLPRTAWCFSPLSGSPAVSPGPVEREGFITFGSFNPMAKINATQVALWSRIVMQTAGARLLLKNRSLSDAAVRERLTAMAESAGLPRDRLTLLPWDASVKEHLRNYDRLDVALDTYPYHGTTTTCEALFMGVPVVSLAGPRHVSRVGASLLRNVGLGDLVAESAAEYVRIAAELGADRGRLAELRKTLRGRMERSPLMDGPALTRDIESAYRTMWRQWCSNNSR